MLVRLGLLVCLSLPLSQPQLLAAEELLYRPLIPLHLLLRACLLIVPRLILSCSSPAACLWCRPPVQGVQELLEGDDEGAPQAHRHQPDQGVQHRQGAEAQGKGGGLLGQQNAFPACLPARAGASACASGLVTLLQWHHTQSIGFPALKLLSHSLTPLQAFSTYLLIAWLTTNIIFAQVVSIVSNLSWENCTESPATVYGNIIKDKIKDGDASQAVGHIVYTAQSILEKAANQYPFGGLPHFPEAYPILLSGNAQSDAQAGAIVTVLAQSTEVFNSLPTALPSFSEWLNFSAGVNINQTVEVGGLPGCWCC